MQSGLSAQTLSQIWNLSDISNTGSLSADEFCLAMYLVCYTFNTTIIRII